MSALHGGRRDQLEIAPNLWAGIGLVRGGAAPASSATCVSTPSCTSQVGRMRP